MIRSVQKALLLLTAISDRKGEAVTLHELSEKTAIPKPTCSHLIHTLCHEGYVKKVSHTKGYILGPSAYYLSRHGRYENELITLVRPIMRWMERKSGAAVVLSVIQNNQKYIIEYSDSEQQFFHERLLIRTDDIYRTATGRSILAQMTLEEVKDIWEQYGPPPKGHWDEIKTFASLTEALTHIRKQPVVITKGTPNAPQGMACPLFEKSVCIGAIGLAFTNTSESEEKRQETEKKLLVILQKGSQEIHRRLAYNVESLTQKGVFS